MDVLQQLGIKITKESKGLASINPATSDIIATVATSSEQDYEKIIKAAQQAFQSWRQVPAPKRGELIRIIAEKLRAKKTLLGSLVAMEMGKIKQEGDGEVQEMIDVAEFAVGQSRMLYGKTMHSERPNHRMYEQWQPMGVVAVFSAFNFPVAVWAWNAFIAAICGNTVVWKPSPKTPLCALALQNICDEAMAEQGYKDIFNCVITDDNKLAEKIVADQRVPLVSFTGSTAVGKKVAAAVAARMGKSILELSGNNAIIADETADLSLLIPSVVFGSVGTTGQRCTTTRRLIIHESRYDECVEQLIKAYKQVKIGDPLTKGTLMGPLIDQVAVDGYRDALDKVKRQGGDILIGGKVLTGKGFFVEPTIVKVGQDCDIVKQETFAPILYVMTYKSLDQAVAIQNNVSQGLSSAIFTESMKHAEYFLSAIGSDCGIANVNIGTSGAEIGGAFGGEKDTGGGRESGSDAWKGYMRRQTNTINWSNELPLAQGIEFTLS